jgi:hypothetical protein
MERVKNFGVLDKNDPLTMKIEAFSTFYPETASLIRGLNEREKVNACYEIIKKISNEMSSQGGIDNIRQETINAYQKQASEKGFGNVIEAFINEARKKHAERKITREK